MKSSTCRDVTLKKKTAKEDGNDTTRVTPSLHLVPFCQLKKTFYMHLAYSHPLNERSTEHSSLHSLPHKRQSISAMFSSNKISKRTLTCHTDPALFMHSTASAYSDIPSGPLFAGWAHNFHDRPAYPLTLLQNPHCKVDLAF